MSRQGKPMHGANRHFLLAALAVAAACACPPSTSSGAFGARAVTVQGAEPSPFDPSQSAALFVGVRRFTFDHELAEVRYAVDDAVDLAFGFALEPAVRLVEPGRVILALSGEPQKEESQQRLNHLRAAGATVAPAGQPEILTLLERQVRSVGKDGVLIVAFATHGFIDDVGNHYLAAATSLLQHRETALFANKIFDIASRSDASLSLILLDTCREQLTTVTKGVNPDPRSAAPLLRPLAHARAQAVLSAATAGDYAYDDTSRRNGVFTAAVIDGLRCEGGTDDRGFVTVDTLATYVNERVTRWRRDHGHGKADQGIEVKFGGTASTMPLAWCTGMPPPTVAPPPSRPAVVRTLDRFFNVFSDAGIRLWGREVKGRIAQAEVADLNGDGDNEVIVGVDRGGEDTGKILAFGATGEPLWSADTTTAPNYSGASSGRMTVRAFVTGDLFRQGTRQVVAVSVDEQGWYPSRLSIFDSDGRLRSSYWHPGHLQKVIIGSPIPQDAPRIIVGGLNNDLRGFFRAEGHLGSVFMLDPTNIRGEAPPYLGKSGQGTHLWYGVLLPTPNQSIEHLEILDRNQDGVKDISVWTSTGHVFYLDFSGQVIGAARADGAQGSSRFELYVEEK